MLADLDGLRLFRQLSICVQECNNCFVKVLYRVTYIRSNGLSRIECVDFLDIGHVESWSGAKDSRVQWTAIESGYWREKICGKAMASLWTIQHVCNHVCTVDLSIIVAKNPYAVQVVGLGCRSRR